MLPGKQVILNTFCLVLCFIATTMLCRFSFSCSFLLLYLNSTFQLEILFLQGPTGPHGNPGQPGPPGPKVSDLNAGILLDHECL